MMTKPLDTIGPIMKAARKFKKLNQAEVAEAIGCSQSALSKMEHNLLVPSAPQWFRFSRFTSIPPESIEIGIIDRHDPIQFNNSSVSKGFKIPKRYRQARAQKVREAYPFFRLLEKDSPQLINDFVASTGMEPEFFLDFDNLVNFQFILDLAGFYMATGSKTEKHARELVEWGQNDLYWDKLGKEWSLQQDPKDFLRAYAQDQVYFQTDFQIRTEGEGEGMLIRYVPEFHLKQGVSYTREVIDFINQYRKYTIEGIFKKLQDKPVVLTLAPHASNHPLETCFTFSN